MSLIIDSELRTKIDTACQTAKEFTKLYYETVDNKRHQMARLYMDDGLLVWNGHGATGKDKIQAYFQQLPRSEHTMNTLNADPIVDEAVPSQVTLIIQVSGYVKFLANPARPFQQTFMVTAQGDKWKIANDCYVLR
ncbi:NTF2-related export protein-like [Sabethes cyaneus]|uniref:NTF2-related export protein-like n=1 Tax=Sabethes cyaneus TaxID=53552 RepID=UPI00237E6D28|nr:NTF2-related export protein-like [Sabethes cyaneus]